MDTIKQFSIFVENKQGKMAELTRLIADAGIDLRTLSLADTRDFGILRIIVNKPDETEALRIRRGEDLCTLVTCTPYGINTHRLMVRGHRVETVAEAKRLLVTAEALQIDEITVALVIGVPILAIVFFVVLVRPRKKTE